MMMGMKPHFPSCDHVFKMIVNEQCRRWIGIGDAQSLFVKALIWLGHTQFRGIDHTIKTILKPHTLQIFGKLRSGIGYKDEAILHMR